jgi:IPT/TIG domain
VTDAPATVPAGSGSRDRVAILAAVMVSAAGLCWLAIALAAAGQHDLGRPTTPAGRRGAGLPPAALARVSGQIGRDQPGYWLTAGGGGAVIAHNASNGLWARFDRSGVLVRVLGGRLGLSLRGFGRGVRLRGVTGARPQVARNRVSYRRKGLLEWYVNGPLGLEQGFRVTARPTGSAGMPLTLALRISGGLRAHLERGGQGLTLARPGRGVELAYAGLRATDASGRSLRACLELSGGLVRVRIDDAGARYPLSIDPFIQQAKLVGSGAIGSTGDQGWSVALSNDGNTALISGITDGNGVGAAWVFVRSGWTWKQQAKLVGSGAVGNAHEGISAALSGDGNTALIGGPYDNTDAGAAWVFVRSNGSWTQQGPKLVPSDAVGPGFDGESVALSTDGSTALIGGFDDNGGVGAAWVFTRSGSSWTQDGAKLVGTGATGAAEQGVSVAVSGDGATALVGGVDDNSGVGAAWVFTRSGSTWNQQGGKLVGSGAVGTPQQGSSVALSGDGSTALIGGPGDNTHAGAAWVFTRSGATWSQQGGKLVGSGEVGEAYTGTSVALSGDGNTALIGGFFDNSGVGAAWMFVRSSGAWSQLGSKLLGSGAIGNAEQGYGVALSSDSGTALIGGPFDNGEAGATWVFTNEPPPTVTGLGPNLGPATGGTTVTITGSNFTPATGVMFGSSSAATFRVDSDTQITATSPTGTGAVDVIVTTPAGASTPASVDKFTYFAAPTVTAVSPSSGPLGGGTSVTISGTGFTGATAVEFGLAEASTFTVDSASQITAVSPAGSPGTVDVTVTTPGGPSGNASGDQFAYVGPPAVTGIDPSWGPRAGGASVTITGSGFSGATAVDFGSSPAVSFAVLGSTSITAISPAGSAGSVDVTVTTPGGVSATSPTDRFAYLAAPAVSDVSPSSGPASGETSVTIAGTGLIGATAVRFGSIASGAFTVNSDTSITAIAPPGSGTVDVTVTNPIGTSATSSNDRYSYSVAPLVQTAAPLVHGSAGAAFSGTVNPEGSTTTAHFEYGLDPKYSGGGPVVYDLTTADQQVGSDSVSHTVSASVSGLVPDALYHARLVATNSVGTSDGPDQTFTTAVAPAPPAPTLGETFNAALVSGLVLIKLPVRGAVADEITKGAGFVPLTQVRQLPSGTQVDARRGTLKLVAAAARSQHIGTIQSVTLSGAVFKIGSQRKLGPDKGLTTLTLQEDTFRGGPSYRSCDGHHVGGPTAQAALSSPVLQTLLASEKRGRFRTVGRYSAATVRGTVWDTIDRCDGTLTIVHRGTVQVTDYARRKTITLHAGQSYLAAAHLRRHR